MTNYQKRVERTARAIYRAVRDTKRKKSWQEITARWHLRMGGRAPGEGARKCETCNGWDVCMYSFKPCRYWRPKRRAGK